MGNNTKKKAVVIGSGVGGVASAALMAHSGYQVTVLERNEITGGKTAITARDGYIVDVAVHVSARGRKGPLGEVARLCDAEIEFIRKNHFGTFIYDGKISEFTPNMHPISLYRIVRLLNLPLRTLPGLMRFLAKLVFGVKSEADIETYRHISAEEFIHGYTRDPDACAFLEACAGLMFVLSSEEASAGEFLIALSGWFKSNGGAYPKGGFGQIPNAYLGVCKKHGGEVLVNQEVKSIGVENGRVTGVRTEDTVYDADIVLCNAGIQQTIALAGRDNFLPDYLKQADALTDSLGAIVMQYALDYAPINTTIGVYIPRHLSVSDMLDRQTAGENTEDNALYLVMPTNVDPSLAPPGKHLLLAGGVVQAEMTDKNRNDQMLDIINKQLEKLFPGFEKHVLWKQERTIGFFKSLSGRSNGNAIGAAQSFKQSGGIRNTPRTPISGLYVVGADTGGVGIGTELAAQSAINAYKDIIKAHS
jgi:prolycopene isomerase